MKIDNLLYNIPVIGGIVKRQYSYFREHIAFTDGIHLALIFGLALLIVGKMTSLGIVALLIGIFGHLWAFVKGKSKS